MALIRERLIPKLEAMAGRASRVATTDASDDDLGEIMDAIGEEYFTEWTRQEFSKVVRSIGNELARFNATQQNRQLSALIGEAISVDVVGNEPWLQSSINEWTRENVSLIKDIPTKLFQEIELFVSRDLADGARWEDLAQIIEDRYSVARSRANLIARDQVGKFNGDLARVRQADLGITEFIWRTMGDERVRTDETAGESLGHEERNGKVYDWNDPPEGETPGEPIQCRCYAEPVIPKPDESTDEG